MIYWQLVTLPVHGLGTVTEKEEKNGGLHAFASQDLLLSELPPTLFSLLFSACVQLSFTKCTAVHKCEKSADSSE